MNKFLNGRKILLGITGGIAAYKIPSLVRLLVKSGCEIEIILTPSAENFVTPMTLAFISEGHNIPHIKLSEWADVIAIAPCSANTCAKIAHGLADNLLTSTILAASCPVIIFPAMNEKMFMNKATQLNLKNLSEMGINIIEPESGDLACGESGRGRMPEPSEIL